MSAGRAGTSARGPTRSRHLWPSATVLALVMFIAAWAVVTGTLELVAAIRLRKEIHGERLLAVSGVMSIVFGSIVFAVPGAGAVGIALILGMYAAASGIVLITLGVRMRNWLPSKRRRIMKRQLNRVTSVAVPLALATLVMSPVAAQQKPAKATPSASAGQQGGAPQKATDAKPQPPPTKADLKDVVRHPDNYLGKTIEVEGEVLDVMPPHMMVIDARRWFHPWGGVLVVTPVPVAGVVIRDEDQVRVIGKVEKLLLAEARKRWSFFSDPKIQIDLLEKPIIVATSAVVIPNP